MRDEIWDRSNNYNIHCPVEIYLLTKDKKGTRCLREIFIKGDTATPIGQKKLKLSANEDLGTIYLKSTKCNLSARIKFFNYQILHHTLITNKKLY